VRLKIDPLDIVDGGLMMNVTAFYQLGESRA